MKPTLSRVCILTAALLLMGNPTRAQPSGFVLNPDAFKHYVDQFNQDDEELYAQHIPNAQAWEFLKDNIPLFECPDKDIERDLLLPLVDLPQAHQADAGRLRHHGVPAAGRLGGQAQHDQLRRRATTSTKAAGSATRSTSTTTPLFWFRKGGSRAQLQFLGGRRPLGAVPGARATTACRSICCPTWSGTTRSGRRPAWTATGCSGRSTTATAWRSPSAAAASGRRSTATCTATPWPSRRSPSWPASTRRRRAIPGEGRADQGSLSRRSSGTARRSSSRSCRAMRSRRLVGRARTARLHALVLQSARPRATSRRGSN